MSVLLYSDKTGNPERHFKRIKNVLKKKLFLKMGTESGSVEFSVMPHNTG